MIVLGVETSCDDTSAGVYDGQRLLSNVISTQLVHRSFGGVVPELASRAHIQLILPVVRAALSQAEINQNHLGGIAVTYGPGLAGSLHVGLSAAKGMASSLHIPFVGVNHLEGHIWANILDNPNITPPFVVLIASGGHTQLVMVESWGDYRILGRTRDDAAGEAFDKVGKLLEIGYPGGPVIERLATEGNSDYIQFPRAKLGNDSLDFSFSGVKTAVLNHVRQIGPDQMKTHLPDIARCFQDAVVDVLVEKTVAAAVTSGVSLICLAGGVAVNKALRQRMVEIGTQNGLEIFWPSPALCTDNGGMIAAAGRHYLMQQEPSPFNLSVVPGLNLE